MLLVWVTFLLHFICVCVKFHSVFYAAFPALRFYVVITINYKNQIVMENDNFDDDGKSLKSPWFLCLVLYRNLTSGAVLSETMILYVMSLKRSLWP